MRRLSFFLFVPLFLYGCTFYGGEISPSSVKKIQPNVTTKEQIVAAFGQPIRTGMDSGFETWRYTYRGVTTQTGWVNRDLYIIFNEDGTVHKYSFDSNKP